MRKLSVMGLFSDFEQAFEAISDIRHAKVPGVTVDDVILKSPIEHPEIEEVLGERPVHIQKVTLFAACFGLIFGFLFIAGAQATFLVQPQGGQPVISLPTNFVLAYEMLIFFAVWMIFFSFIFFAGLLRKRHTLYSEAVSLDQIGILIDVEPEKMEAIKELFKTHKAVEIRQEGQS